MSPNQPTSAIPDRTRGYFGRIVCLVCVMLATPGSWGDEPSPANPAEASPTYYEDVLPILRKNCLACHHQKLAEGGLVLESLETLQKGGDSGPLVDPSNPQSSLLVGRADGTVGEIMPPEDNDVGAARLTREELDLIIRWIGAGMPSGTAPSGIPAAAWQNIPQSLRSIYAIAASPDGGLVAVGRGNSLALLDVKGGGMIQDLVDPALAAPPAAPAGSGQSAPPPTPARAQLDFVNSLAFDPRGGRFASGDFRAVKIWHQHGLPQYQQDSLAGLDAAKQQVLIGSLFQALATSMNHWKRTDVANLLDGIDLGGIAPQALFAAGQEPLAVVVLAGGELRLVNLQSKQVLATLIRGGAAKLHIDRLQRDAARQKGHAEYVAGLIAPGEEAVKKEEEVLAKIQTTQQEQTTALEMRRGELATAEAELKGAQEATEPPTEAAKIEELTKKRDEAQKTVKGAEDALAATNQALAAATDARDQTRAGVERIRQELALEQQLQASLEQEYTAAQSGLALPEIHAITIENPASDQGRIAVQTADGEISIYGRGGGHPVAVLRGHPSPANRIVFLGTQSLAAINVDPADPATSLRWSLWQLGQAWGLEAMIGDPTGDSPLSDRVSALEFSPDGKWLLVGSGQPSRLGEIVVIDMETRQVKTIWDRLHSDTVLAIKFSPNGKYVASAGADRQIRIVDFPSGENMRSLEGHTHHVLGLAWQDHGRRLASVSADHTVKIWDVRNNQAERTIAAGNKELAAVAFVGTTSQIALCSGSGVVSLYNADNGGHIRNYQGVSGFQMALAADPGGQWLAAGGDLGNFRLWSVESDQPKVLWPTP